jgi:hypothetical protein
MIFLLHGTCPAQNLLPNGDFELKSGCPTNWSQIDSALFWFTPSTGSPDYFNQCANPIIGVPTNFLGHQPAQNGNAYSGIYLRQSSFDIREYIETSFTSPLTANSCYHFEMYVNLGDRCQYTTDAIGAYFSDTSIAGVSNMLPLPFTPQINNTTGNYFDTLSWTLVSGDYLASGGENYLVIGNFKDDASTTFQLINSSAASDYVYCFIDNISLIEYSPCNTGINTVNETAFATIFPTIFNENLTVQTNNLESPEIILYDISGRKIIEQKFHNSISIRTELLKQGLYIYEIRVQKKVIKAGKVIKE